MPGLTRKLWFRDDTELFAPQDLLEEANEREKELRAKFRGHQEAYAALKRILFLRVRKISGEDLDRYAEATGVLAEDADDRVFLAAALHVGCDIWSNDADLKRQGGSACGPRKNLHGTSGSSTDRRAQVTPPRCP